MIVIVIIYNHSLSNLVFGLCLRTCQQTAKGKFWRERRKTFGAKSLKILARTVGGLSRRARAGDVRMRCLRISSTVRFFRRCGFVAIDLCRGLRWFSRRISAMVTVDFFDAVDDRVGWEQHRLHQQLGWCCAGAVGEVPSASSSSFLILILTLTLTTFCRTRRLFLSTGSLLCCLDQYYYYGYGYGSWVVIVIDGHKR